MKRIGLTLVLLFAQLGFAAGPTPLDRLQAKVQVAPVSGLTLSNLAGKYSDPTKEFSPGLSGNDLYLFPDGTYVYDEWADIQPLTIYDKGRWHVEDGIIVLLSDDNVTWNPGVERRYIAVYRRGHPNEILLIGTSDELARFEEGARDQPETELMIVAKERSAAIGSSKSGLKIKRKLMQTSWNPDYFKAEKR